MVDILEITPEAKSTNDTLYGMMMCTFTVMVLCRHMHLEVACGGGEIPETRLITLRSCGGKHHLRSKSGKSDVTNDC